MKKILAALLTACMIVQTCVGTSALAAERSQESLRQAEASADGAVQPDAAEQSDGAVEVEIRSSLDFPYRGKVTVQITGDSKEVTESKEFDFDTLDSDFALAKFDVMQGNYEISVLSDGFAEYRQSVQVKEGFVSKIILCSTFVGTEGDAAPGWIRPGDVNGDNVLDNKDADAVLSAIRENPEKAETDINGDGVTDLADLQNLVQGIDENRESHIEQLGYIRGTTTIEGTSVEGSMEDFMDGAGQIALKPSNENAAISNENPVGLAFVLAKEDAAKEQVPGIQGVVIHSPVDTEDGGIDTAIGDGEATVVYIDEDGSEREQVFSLSATQQKAAKTMRKMRSLQRASLDTAKVKVNADGSLVLDFGTQIAVKRVLIKITGTKKTEPLVNIAKVEFVNDMEKRIPAPELDIPTLEEPVSEDAGFTVSWDAQRNVTGYEVYVSGPVKKQTGNETQIVRVDGTSQKLSSINDKPMKNFEKYTVKVRSVNGDWRSPWSDEKTAEPKPQKLPAPPDQVKAQGGYRSIAVSWKDMDDSDGYMVYYKKTEDKDAAYMPVKEGFTPVVEGTGKLETTYYTITGLEDGVSYSLYVIGWNQLGWGKASLTAVAETKSGELPRLPEYRLLNTSNGEGVLTSHIVDATIGGHGGAAMVESPLDTSVKSGLGLVDDDYASYWMKNDWDDGVAYPASNKGVFVTLDDDYRMNYITFASVDQKIPYNTLRFTYWNSDNPKTEQLAGARLLIKYDENNNPYYIVRFDKTITANKIHLSLGRTYSRGEMKIGEIHFHKYDSLEDDIMGLYVDEMHTTLRDDVTEEVIAGLERALNTTDEASGEKHPLYSELLLELKTAREILNAGLAPSYEVHNSITAQKDGHLGFGGLNAWQPLGRVAYTGESLLVYVGHNTKRTGDSTNLQLVFTQYHSESGGFSKVVNLKIGRNEITVPQITTNDFERGGQLYIAYTGNSTSDKYAVRISGGSEIPVLDVYGKTGEERTEAIREYVAKLEAYVGGIEAEHEAKHIGVKHVNYDYDRTNCILNSTDIMMKEMMYSLPATQVWAGLANAEDKVTKLDIALKAMEDTMTLFYQHKGLSDEAGTLRGNNALPSQHLNIRYMRMFAGAFMYASGNHIGIEWGSCGLASGPSSWSGFGWGVAHEIGHNINQGTYAIAEVTNNYFAQLLTKVPGKTRFTYDNVYKKVTSGAIGRSSNVATQLALYWQLHLAYDNNTDDRHIFDNYEEQFNNLFFARVDTYSRNPSKAPQAGLTLNGGTDQNLMRLACAAANKNIIPFFERWGMVPDEATLEYAAKYGEPETKALYYVNDDARDYRAAHPSEEGSIKDMDAVNAVISTNSNKVEINITTDKDEDLILGYEIVRTMTSNGQKSSRVVGFKPIDTAQSTVYVDTIATINNRVMEYEVRAVDKYLNYSNTAYAGSAKIQTDGVLDKSEWSVETTMKSDDDIAVDSDSEDPDNGYNASNPSAVGEKKIHSIDRVIDNDLSEAGTYNGVSENGASITIDMHRTEEITALKYVGDAIESVTVEVSADGNTWTTVKDADGSLNAAGEHILWFDSVNEEERDSWIGTYDARYVKLTFTQSGNISISEIDVCGPSGDNLAFMTTGDNRPAIGVLQSDYKYGSKPEDVITKGSLIFTGVYKGNPAYNVVVLYDSKGNVIGAKDDNVQAGQVIFADVPEAGNLGETSDGTWVYYVEPGQWDEETVKQLEGVRGELYRVDNALTLEGERIVSDTQMITVPDELPDIILTDTLYTLSSSFTRN
ncbi:MAG: hypothetical protein HFH14_06130 [Lachnospiraceae bacterium]|nr:hypothetical protein [Lachnospiraceae bacterium]